MTHPRTLPHEAHRTAGTTLHAPPQPRLALFQLTGQLTYPDLEGAGSSHYTVEPTPYAAAKRVWCHQFDPDDQDGHGHPLRSYGGSSLSKEETVYHPAAFRNGAGYAIGHPTFRSGDRVFCVLNRQSGRWEIVAPALSVCRFELKSALTPGGSATAYLLPWHEGAYGFDAHVELTVYDAVCGTLRGWARTQTFPGSRGYAQYLPDSGRWEIVAMQQKARWVRFQLTQELTHGTQQATADVLNYWDGYAPSPNNTVTVFNCAAGLSSQYIFAGASGAIGLGCYDPAGDSYWIVQMECPA
jgi:hypothetical protein